MLLFVLTKCPCNRPYPQSTFYLSEVFPISCPSRAPFNKRLPTTTPPCWAHMKCFLCMVPLESGPVEEPCEVAWVASLLSTWGKLGHRSVSSLCEVALREWQSPDAKPGLLDSTEICRTK